MTGARGLGGRLRRGLVVSGAVLVAMVAVLGAAMAPARAIDKTDLVAQFAPPMFVGEKLADLPVWPILENTGGADRVAYYAFETTDLAPIPGFSGTPPNLLVILGADGTFRQVRVLSQHEPVFVEGLGQEPLDAFVEQYVGKSLGRPIKVVPPGKAAGLNQSKASASVAIDGVAKATASVRIINESVLAAALAVARAKLDMAQASPVAARPIRADVEERHDASGLVEAGLLTLARVRNRDIEAAFAGSGVEGTDDVAAADPDGVFAELAITVLDIPSAGRSLFGAEGMARLLRNRDPDAHSLFVQVGGRFEPFGDGYVFGAVPDMFSLTQADLPISIRDTPFERPLVASALGRAPYAVYTIFAQSGFDPARPFTFNLHVTRTKGQLFPEVVTRIIPVRVALPERYFLAAEARAPEATGVVAIWLDRAGDIAATLALIALAAVVLAMQGRTTRRGAGFVAFRLGFLLVTLVLIGWIQQAQLSIVTVTGLVKAIDTRDLTFLLWDPVSLVIWGAAILGAIAWGRGFFCGWLCPFGALQEWAAWLARPLRLRQVTPPDWLDRRLRGLKYAVLAGLVGVALAAPSRAEVMAEVEPFKTAITLGFVRWWPMVAYAVGLLVLNLFIYKAFCRYLCPLGAVMAILGKARRFDWIARRTQCGSPCQLCRVKCRYGAIDRAGVVDYDECFQCMDCVIIHNDAETCVPLVLARRAQARGRVTITTPRGFAGADGAEVST